MRVCVFCGSARGNRPEYSQTAALVGTLLAQKQIGLVYGGARVGLMGAVAEAALAAGGEVVGVMPQSLMDREIAHAGLSQLHVVGSMHERKALMASLSDAFLALPGGYGTLDELCEILTWAQIRLHNKPIGLLNVQGYYDSLLALFRHAAGEGLLQARHHRLLITGDDPATLIHQLTGR